MKKKKALKLIALVTAMSLLGTGCGSVVGEDVASYQLDSPLTRQEVIDYYAKALDYDAVISKNVTVHETEYVTQDIEGEKAERLKSLTEQCEAILGQKTYELTEDTKKLVSEDTFNYIKVTLDNDTLSNGKIQSITGALGYYFVDVTYDVSPSVIGQFNSLASFSGINGIYYSHYDGSYSLDDSYVEYIVEKLNDYFNENKILKNAVYNDESKLFEIQEGVKPDVKTKTVENVSNLTSDGDNYEDDWFTDDYTTTTSDDTEYFEGDDEVLNLPGDSNEDTEVSTLENTEQTDDTFGGNDSASDLDFLVDNESGDTDDTTSTTSSDASTSSESGYKSLKNTDSNTDAIDPSRQVQFDAALVNKVAGSSVRQRATIPDLATIYSIPEPQGEISGYGIANSGGDGVKYFGLDRANMQGTATLRYVFKDDVNGTGDILGTNIYMTEENITNGITSSDNTVLLPEFLKTELEKVVERADRVNANCDLAGMLSGSMYQDLGVGVLRSFKDQSTGVNKYMSTIRQIIERNTTYNVYLLELETTTIEGPRDVDCYGTYKDKGYMVIQQQGNEFVIMDYIRISRSMISEPPINPDSTIQKRLVALNLAGEIPEDSKEEITSLMSDLYTAGTNRLLRGPKDITVKGETITLEKGLYDCFQDDSDILSTTELEYTMSKLTNALIKHGADVSSVYSGIISTWNGGYDNQAEFTTEELITYNGRDDAYYMEVYYLVSKLNDKWVIDERTILDEEEITNAVDIQTIKERVGQ